jgi:hypothetical protein
MCGELEANTKVKTKEGYEIPGIGIKKIIQRQERLNS